MARPGAGKPGFLVLRGTRKSGPPLPLFAECNALFLSPPLVFHISFNFSFSNVGARLFESAQNIYAEGQISLRRIWRGKLGRPAKRRGRRGVAGGGSAVPKGTAKASHGQLFWASVFCIFYYSSTKHSAGGADLGPWGQARANFFVLR